MEPAKSIRSESIASRDWPSCPKSFTCEYLSETHCRQHTDTRPFACYFPNCGKHCSSLDALNEHSREHQYKFSHPGYSKIFARRDAMESHLRPHQKVVSPNGIDDCSLVAGDDKSPSTSQHSPMAGLPLETLSTGQDASNELLHLGSPNVPMTNSPVLFAQQCSAESTAINAIYDTGNRLYKCKWPDCEKTFTQKKSMRVHAKACRFQFPIFVPSDTISELGVEVWHDSATGRDGVPSPAQPPLDSNLNIPCVAAPRGAFHSPWIGSQLIEPSTENDTAMQHPLSPEREHQSTSPPTSNLETSTVHPIGVSYQYTGYEGRLQGILPNRRSAADLPHSLDETPYKRRDSSQNANLEAARAAITMPINGRNGEFICLYCQGHYREDTRYERHVLDCFTDQNWYGDDNYQFLGQAAPERLVHTDRTLSNPSPQFRTESPTLQATSEDSFVSQSQLQFHHDHKPLSPRVGSGPQNPTGSPVSDTSNTIGKDPSGVSPQARASPNSKPRSLPKSLNLRVSLVHGEYDTEDRTTLGYQNILSITLDRIIQQLTPLQSTNPEVQIRLNRIRDYYLQRDIEHGQETESCDTGSHKDKQSHVKKRIGAITKSTISQGEDNDAQSKISELKMILPELEEVDLSKIPEDELGYVLDVLFAVKTCS